MQIDWLDFALNNTNLSEPEMMEFRKKRELAAKNSERFFYLVEDSISDLKTSLTPSQIKQESGYKVKLKH